MVQEKKQKKDDPVDLWSKIVKPIPAKKFIKDVANTEKLLVFSETGAGKTTFYLNILRYLKKQGVDKKDIMMTIIFPDRPTGISKIHEIAPTDYLESCVYIFPVNNYEDTIAATASSEKMLLEHYEKTGKYGWMVFELLENYWSFAQDYYSRQAYGVSMGNYFAQMRQTINSKEKQAAYEAFAGPYGGPWPIIKFFHNYNWIDRVKRMPFNTIFTSEIKEEINKDSIFSILGLRPAGEKHNMHRVDTILYLSHKGNDFFMKPFKITGYKMMYSEIKITNKNSYEVHKKMLERLEKYKSSKIEDMEEKAGIKLPTHKKTKEEVKEIVKEKETKEVIEETTSDDEQWDI